MKKFNSLLSVMGIALISLLTGGSSMAQINNPLQTDPSVWNSRELMVLWGEANQDQDVQVKQAIFGVDFQEYLQQQTSPFVTRVGEEPIPQTVFDPGVRPMATQSGDYDNDGEDELLYAVSQSNNIRITAPFIVKVDNADSTTTILLGPSTTYVDVYTGVNAAYTPGRGIPLLIKGDFDGDGAEEFALAARNSDGEIIVQLIDMDGVVVPQLRANNHSETSVLDDYNSEVFDICSGDFDGDGDDEIALVCLKHNTTGSGHSTVFLRLFDVIGDGCTTLVEKGSQIVDDQLILPQANEGANTASIKVAVQSIHNTEGAGADKLLVAFAFSPFDEESQSNYYMRLESVSSDLSEISILDEINGATEFQHNQQIDIKCGDLNGDRWDNPVLMIGTQFQVYSAIGDSLVFKTASDQATFQPEGGEYQTDNFEISDIDKNGRQNLLYTYTLKNSPSDEDRSLYIKSVELNSDYSEGTIISKNIATIENYSVVQMYFGFTTGNFDGDDLELGTPIPYDCVYRRPLFILAPPPVHFDHINGENYDFSGCFTGDDCLFYASNTMQENSVSTLSITDKSDWNVSATASVGFEGLSASVGASMTAKYGEGFSQEIDSTSSQSISVQNTVTVDDLIKGVQYHVKVEEYPVYNANGDLINYIRAVFPQYDDVQEYQEQGKLDPHYIPDYEPGNLLSYPPIGSVSDFDQYSAGSLIYEGSIYTVSNNIGQSGIADISQGHVYGATGTRSNDASVSATLSASGFGLGFEMTGDYSQSQLNLNSTEMSGSEGFRIRYDNISGPSGYNAYKIKPYIFWSKDGAGILTYQVDVTSSESSPTWWDLNYGTHPDPALMIPLGNEEYYNPTSDPNNPAFTHSKSMTFNRLYPNVGDEVTVQCRVFNYSLMATSGPVEVSFYNGNPNEGGVLLSDLNGQTVFETPEAIPARGKSVVEMTFSMPLPLNQDETFVRFYAVIDPDNQVEEIHEKNNMGWQTIGYDCENQSGTNSIYEYYDKDKYSEMWVWPNPATDKVNLAFNMAIGSRTSIEIFDMQGKRVLSKDLGMIAPGSQEVAVDLPPVSPGIYFVQLNSKEFTRTQKLMVR